MKTRMYIVRHGQTEWNVAHRMQGHHDAPLTVHGIQQVEALAKRLHNVHWDKIFSSPSGRAVKTAEILRGSRHVPIVTTAALKEIGLGAWEGQTREKVQAQYPQENAAYWQDPDHFVPPQGGETFHEVQQRVQEFLGQTLRQYAGQSILIVTHTVPVKLLLAHFMQRDLRDLWQDPAVPPASLTEIEIQPNCVQWYQTADIS
ncbi:MAG: histidine phosphatase family protein, partial [Firmicutes bacterium]|nr:histidine phosphatase family protein [Bacillota bacterium]